tara:strand:+ start:2331 stop:3419 length:1089 start_codon:yes stop_codon:yes gene_type:complete
MSDAKLGLEDVVVAETELSRVDGQAGRLVLRGYALRELAGVHPFEEVTGLLWEGALGRPIDLGPARVAAHARSRTWGGALELPDGMDALRAALAQGVDPSLPEGPAILGTLAVAAAGWWRRRQGLELLEPDPSLSHAADYLRLLRGAAPTAAEAAALDTYLVTVTDHGLNASTFAARVVASTASDLVSALVAAIGALKGPLHGGAPGPVLDMFDAIGSPARAEAWVAAELKAGRRIMGMGHRVYRTRDPRAAVLTEAAGRLGDPRGRIEMAEALEEAAARLLAERKPDRPLRANVELFTAVILEALDLDRALFSPTFAVARSAGWVGHVNEQRARGRLLRPRARYVGPEPRALEGAAPGGAA